MNKLLKLVASALGYVDDPGFVVGKEFDRQPNHRHALRLASQRMGVQAAFGLWTGRAGAILGPDRKRFTPLVFLAQAEDEAQAREIHRRAWSQGLAPYLIIATKTQAWLCQGFAFSSTKWTTNAKELSIASDQFSIEPDSPLHAVTARALRSSIAWRDEARSADEFIDERLLNSLAELSVAFSRPGKGRRKLHPAAANALIARLLYFYFLVDRKFVTSTRLAQWGLSGIDIDGDRDWTPKATQSLFKRLDDVFNGSIFPMLPDHEGQIDSAHVNDLRRVLRHGGHLHADGGMQLGFLDYDFASIRTETLSAIYEMFLRSEEADAGHRFGAFYTPPYLADYVLDRLEDERPLGLGVRVLDPAAGSGVFLVGAYRRIVEAKLAVGHTQLPLETLHKLMTECIFGVELNDTACHVAAFSLYLTMLDYVDPDEAADYAAWPVVKGNPRLFPPMLAGSKSRPANIRNADFFSVPGAELRCDVVVGNPPWVQLPKLGSSDATAYAAAHASEAPIGDKQAAELFLWKALRDHLSPNGALSILLPQKSLVNAMSDTFAEALRRKTEIVGIADLAHLRYVLFRRSAALGNTPGSDQRASKIARQPTAAIVVRNCPPSTEHRFWTYRPLRPSQPASRKGRLWILIHDWTQIQWHQQIELDEKRWLRVFTCSAVDRRIMRSLDRQLDSGRLVTLDSLEKSIGLQFKIEVDQNIDRRYVIGTDQTKPNYWLYQLGLESDGLFHRKPTAVPLPAAQIDRAVASAKPFLQGNIVLMPRSCEVALFIRPPVAFSFMIGACFPEYGGRALPRAHQQFLKALSAYMSTAVFRYLCFISSRRMLTDRAQVELGTVKGLPWPFGLVGDNRLAALAAATVEDRESLALKALGITASYASVIDEFSNFRSAFRDGGRPTAALEMVTGDDVEAYEKMLLAEVDGGKKRYRVSWHDLGDANLGALLVRFVGDGTSKPDHSDSLEFALSDYHRYGASSLSQARYLWHSRKKMESVLIKPKERMHWSRDRAFSDADALSAAIMSGFDSREAAA